MKLQATRRGEWPTGVHWTVGEVRELDVKEGAEIPNFLVSPKPKKAAKKAAKAD